MRPDSDYDVVIAGAGPAGSVTAKCCAEAGLKVLLLEKKPEIGAPKRCGEYIRLGALEKVGFSGNENFALQKISGGILFAPNMKRIDIPNEKGGYVLERKLFDKHLAYNAASAGAKVIAKAEVKCLIKKGGKVEGVVVDYCGEKLSIGAKVIVAADGVESVIARLAGLKINNTTRNIGSAYQYEMAGIDIEDPKKLYFYIGGSVVPQGYIWIFPKGEHIANVGIGLPAKDDGSNAKYYLDRWIQSMPGIKKGSIIEVNAGGIPHKDFLKTMTSDNFLAVGDAVRQVNPIHGGGIAEAIDAAMIASDVIIKAIKEGDTSKESLDRYNKRWWKERGDSLFKLQKMMNAFEQMTDEDINNLVNSLDSGSILKIINGDLLFSAKLMMKNPRLVALAAKLI